MPSIAQEYNGFRPSQQRLEESIPLAVTRRVRNFQLIREPDGIIVRGSTTTYYDKQLAQAAVMSAFIEPILSNEIEVG